MILLVCKVQKGLFGTRGSLSQEVGKKSHLRRFLIFVVYRVVFW
jgi:hypothetical protein